VSLVARGLGRGAAAILVTAGLGLALQVTPPDPPPQPAIFASRPPLPDDLLDEDELILRLFVEAIQSLEKHT
jgi:hypothetical protein